MILDLTKTKKHGVVFYEVLAIITFHALVFICTLP